MSGDGAQIDVVFLADAVTPPLTGVGRYGWELARRMSSGAFPTRLTAMTMSGVKLPEQLVAGLEETVTGDGTAKRRGGFPFHPAGLVKSVLRQAPFAAHAVEDLRRSIFSARLRRYRGTRNLVVHGPNFFAPGAGLPTVVTVHDLSTMFYPEAHPPTRVRRVGLMLDEAVRRGFHILTDATATRHDIITTLGVAPDRVSVAPLGVGHPFGPTTAMERRDALATYGLHDGGYCLSVATTEPRKNLSRLIDAYAALPLDLRRAYPLILAGAAGWRNAGLLRKIAAMEREGWGRQLGFVPQGHLPALYGGARLFVYPSIYEGFGLPVIEAMACGAPVVTSNASTLPEVAGGAALLANPLDEGDISQCLVDGLTDAVWRAGAIDAGLRRAADLTWERTTEETIAVYRHVLRQC
ncbi:MAG: glycosyltransferase family 4 protein [Niveispirillum sp.]